VGLITHLIEKALKRREGLALPSGNSEQYLDKVLEVWIEKEPSPEPAGLSVSAVDGSRNRKEYVGYTVYAIAAASVLSKPHTDKLETHYLVDVDVLKPEEYSESRLRILMGILEAKEAVSSLKDCEVLLIDGSLIGNLIRPAVFNYEISEEGKSYAESIYREMVSSFSTNTINSKEFYSELQKRFTGREYAVVAGYLEYLEYLHSYKILLETGKEKIIAVSKRSESRIYGFDQIVSDIAVLNAVSLHLPEGFSRPNSTKLTREIKFSYPEEFEEFFRELELETFFFKLPGGGVYKCETVKPPEEVWNILSGFSINGYPYLLTEAHKRVKIGREEMERVLKTLKATGVTGREGLGE